MGNLERAKFEAVSCQNHRTGTGTKERKRYVNNHNSILTRYLNFIYFSGLNPAIDNFIQIKSLLPLNTFPSRRMDGQLFPQAKKVFPKLN
jgi:hypothetical protein